VSSRNITVLDRTCPAPALVASSGDFWSAPASVSRLWQFGGDSSWSIYVRPADGRLVALPLNHEPAAIFHQRGGRTAGRALRALRRQLRREPVAF
jgi:hypothetical protein